jgi:hypothetical protein
MALALIPRLSQVGHETIKRSRNTCRGQFCHDPSTMAGWGWPRSGGGECWCWPHSGHLAKAECGQLQRACSPASSLHICDAPLLLPGTDPTPCLRCFSWSPHTAGTSRPGRDDWTYFSFLLACKLSYALVGFQEKNTPQVWHFGVLFGG